jgi:hypothetical protein
MSSTVAPGLVRHGLRFVRRTPGPCGAAAHGEVRVSPAEATAIWAYAPPGLPELVRDDLLTTQESTGAAAGKARGPQGRFRLPTTPRAATPGAMPAASGGHGGCAFYDPTTNGCLLSAAPTSAPSDPLGYSEAQAELRAMGFGTGASNGAAAAAAAAGAPSQRDLRPTPCRT